MIVIGAGAAGLAATKQLKNMGCEVGRLTLIVICIIKNYLQYSYVIILINCTNRCSGLVIVLLIILLPV